MRRLLVIPLALSIAVGCHDNPVQPPTPEDTTAPSPALGAAVGDWQLLASLPLDFTDFVPCFNAGQGELATWYATYNLWEKELTTPSGNINRVQRITFTGSVYWQTASGETWTLVKMTEPGFVHTKKSDGKTYAQWSLHELYENAAGKRVTMMSVFKYVIYDYQNWWDAWDPDEVEIQASCGGSGAH